MTDPKNMEVEFDSKQLDFAEKSEKFGHLILVVDGIETQYQPQLTLGSKLAYRPKHIGDSFSYGHYYLIQKLQISYTQSRNLQVLGCCLPL